MPPEVFVAAAERTGLIDAPRRPGARPRLPGHGRGAAHSGIPLARAREHLRDPARRSGAGRRGRVGAGLGTTCRAASLVLEITETSMVPDVDAAMPILQALRGRGIRLALDDFGTGFSSLVRTAAALYQPDEDRSLLRRDHRPQRERHGDLRSTINLGGPGFHMTAEGMETAARARLAAMGCELAQGYGLCPPLPAAQCARAVPRAYTLRERGRRRRGGRVMRRAPRSASRWPRAHARARAAAAPPRPPAHRTLSCCATAWPRPPRPSDDLAGGLVSSCGFATATRSTARPRTSRRAARGLRRTPPRLRAAGRGGYRRGQHGHGRNRCLPASAAWAVSPPPARTPPQPPPLRCWTAASTWPILISTRGTGRLVALPRRRATTRPRRHVAGVIGARDTGYGVAGFAPAPRSTPSRSWTRTAAGRCCRSSAASTGSPPTHQASASVANMTSPARVRRRQLRQHGRRTPGTRPCAAQPHGRDLGRLRRQRRRRTRPHDPRRLPRGAHRHRDDDTDGMPGGAGPAPSCKKGEADDRYAAYSNLAMGPTPTAHTIAAPGTSSSRAAGGGLCDLLRRPPGSARTPPARSRSALGRPQARAPAPGSLPPARMRSLPRRRRPRATRLPAASTATLCGRSPAATTDRW